MMALSLAATLVSLALFAAGLVEAVRVTRIIGKIPRFWLFFLAAISFLILRRILVLAAAAFNIGVPEYWSDLDTDGTPIIFSGLLLIWIYEMRKSFQRSAEPEAARAELVAPEKA